MARSWYDRNKHIFPASRWEVVRASFGGRGSRQFSKVCVLLFHTFRPYSHPSACVPSLISMIRLRLSTSIRLNNMHLAKNRRWRFIAQGGRRGSPSGATARTTKEKSTGRGRSGRGRFAGSLSLQVAAALECAQASAGLQTEKFPRSVRRSGPRQPRFSPSPLTVPRCPTPRSPTESPH